MTHPIVPCTLRARLECAHQVTVIPVTTSGHLVTLTRDPDPDQPARYTLPTSVKGHPRVRTIGVARRLLAGLGCAYTDLRPVAILDPRPPHHHRHAVYTALVCWPTGQPAHAACGAHRLHLITGTGHIDLHPARVAALLWGPDPVAVARHLPELACPHQHPAPARPELAFHPTPGS